MKSRCCTILLALLFSVFMAATLFTQDWPYFWPPSLQFNTGSSPDHVVIGDINENGHQDIATANYYAGDVTILLGNSDGSFSDASSFYAGFGPEPIAMGDFNEDGHQDLAGPSVTVLSGNYEIPLLTSPPNETIVIEALVFEWTRVFDCDSTRIIVLNDAQQKTWDRVVDDTRNTIIYDGPMLSMGGRYHWAARSFVNGRRATSPAVVPSGTWLRNTTMYSKARLESGLEGGTGQKHRILGPCHPAILCPS